MNQDARLPELIGATWAQAEDQALDLLASARASASAIRWAPKRSRGDEPMLLAAEREGEAPVRESVERPPADEDRHKWVACGYDARERLVFSERRKFEGSPEQIVVVVPALDDRDVRVHLTFLASGSRTILARVAIPHCDGPLLARLELLYDPRDSAGVAEESYEYDGERRLRRIEIVRRRDSAVPEQYGYDVERDAAGEPTLVRHRKQSGESVVYRRRSPAAVRKARQRSEGLLVKQILAWAARTAPDEPVYCLAVVYDSEPFAMPATLAWGTERERRNADSRDMFAIYTPSEFERFDPMPPELETTALSEDLAILEQEWKATEDTSEPGRLLTKVARSVARSLEIQRTEDFIAYAVESDLDNLKRSLRAAGLDPASLT